jgi:hypothetical protein
MYVTRISLKDLDESTRKQVINVAAFCEQRDPTFSFEVKDHMLEIKSEGHDQAMKRGSYFHLKFPQVYYNVEKTAESATTWRR